VIKAGVQWLVGLLGGPAGAFIKAVKAIIDIVMWFVNNAGRLMSLVQAILQSVKEIAGGNIAAAAKYVEDSLAKAIPVVIGLLASLLGLGGLAQKVKGIIQRVQAPINKAVDWILGKAKAVVKKLGKALGLGKKDDKTADGADNKVNEQARKKARQQVATVTQQPFKDERELKTAVKRIETNLIPEGLQSLSVMPRQNMPGQYDIVARAEEEDVGDAKVGGNELQTVQNTFGDGFFQRQQVQDLLAVSKSKALSLLNEWIAAGVLYKHGASTATQYTFDSTKKLPAKPGAKHDRLASVRRGARKGAIQDLRESVESGIYSPQALHFAERYGRDALVEVAETGKLPPDAEFSHLYSAAEYPEHAHRPELGVLTDKGEHRFGHHGGDTRVPLHGAPRDPDWETEMGTQEIDAGTREGRDYLGMTDEESSESLDDELLKDYPELANK